VARVLQRRDDVEGDEELVLHDENGMRANQVTPFLRTAV
jgi:hypothetical protein